MTEQIKLIVSDICIACTGVKRALEDDIKTGRVKVVDINTKEGMDIAEKAKLTHVPTAVSVEGNSVKKCRILRTSEGKAKIQCP